MSLINDALKKAQRERTGEPQATAPIPGGRPRRSSSQSRPNGVSAQVILLAGGAVAGLLIATGALFMARQERAETTAAAATVASARPAETAPGRRTEPTRPEATKTTAAPASEAKPAAAPSVLFTTSAAPSASSTATTLPQIVATKPPAEPAPAKAAPEKSAPVETTPAQPARASSKFVNAVDALRVMGIRASAGNDSKVLMNDRVFRVGDTVNHDLGIKLAVIESTALTFVDANGATYTRHF